MQRIYIIDSRACNLNSVYQGLKRLEGDYEIKISHDEKELNKADKLIFPGVGSMSSVMQGISDFHLIDFVKSVKKPILGICLGMQILFEASEEVPLHSTEQSIKTLGILKGTVKRLDCGSLPLPHIGWNSIEHTDHPLFSRVKNGSYVYFVHSYCAPLGSFTMAKTNYGQDFSAAVCRDNFMGVQFHPEKSGPIGALILKNFAEAL